MDIGRNPIREIPNEFSLLQKLERLWLDDCQLSGPIPSEFFSLENLRELRISNNALDCIQTDDPRDICSIKNLSKLEILCLDGNRIETIPRDLIHLTYLRSLLLRKNEIKELPEGIPGRSHDQLTLFHISNNKIKQLPESIVLCPVLEAIYANANEITDLSSIEQILTLKTCNVSNNKITKLSSAFVERFGDPEKGKCSKVRKRFI